MSIISLILFIVAAVIFAFGNRAAPSWYSHLGLGLCVLTVGFIVQLLETSHPLHF